MYILAMLATIYQVLALKWRMLIEYLPLLVPSLFFEHNIRGMGMVVRVGLDWDS
jgi:hypothetical protein